MGAPPVGERQRFAETDRPGGSKHTRWALLKDPDALSDAQLEA
jgi:hypothetical protein